MNIIEALKSGWHRNLRISNGERWLIWDEEQAAWVVYGRVFADREIYTFITTQDEEEAVKYLLYQETVPLREAYLPQEGVDKVPGGMR